MKTMRLLLCFSVLTFMVAGLASCKKDQDKSRLSVYLTDSPADYDAVNIDIVAIAYKTTDDQGENGWQEMPLAHPGVYNLLDFRNGMDTILSSIELPAGRISQLRLILGTNNSLVMDGSTFELPLETPSAQQSGLKFNIHAELVEGVEYKVWIDFDAAKSVVNTGSDKYVLKPVIRTFTEALSGAIKGIVLPAEADPVVHAISGTDTLTALPDTTNGNFLIRGVPAGTWKVVADASNGYNDQTIDNVTVTLGQVTDVHTITLTQ